MYRDLLVLLVAHFVGDFLLQTHWQASNKSKNNVALLQHVGIYTGVIGIAALFVVGPGYPLWAAFVFLNGMAHLMTDYLTSRWSARHFAWALRDTFAMRDAARLYGENADLWVREHAADTNPGRHWHNFFVVIGFDQLIHGLTLGGTLWLARM